MIALIIIASCSVFIALGALIHSIVIGHRQKKSNKILDELNKIQLNEKMEELGIKKKAILTFGYSGAEVGALFIHISNKGGSPATNINFTLAGDSRWKLKPNQLPIPKIEAGEIFDIKIFTFSNAGNHDRGILTWNGPDGPDRKEKNIRL